MRYLIDGYNFLHAMGRPQPRASLEKARLRLLTALHAAFGEESTSLSVVFDAGHAPVGATEVQDFHGIRVRFAVRHDQADDLIEELVRREPAPRQLTVVSDDHRLQKAGRRRGCPVMGCAEFLEWLDRRRGPAKKSAGPTLPRNGAAEPIKPESVSREETQRWLREFSALENESDFKEAFNPFDFDGPRP